MYTNLMDIIWRVAIGTMALGCVGLPFMQCYATIGTMYSLRRVIGHATDPAQRTPILTFRTQQAPILTTAANAYVMQAFQRWAIGRFCDARIDSRVRHGIAAIFKSIMVQHSQQGALSVSERCGAQGLFAHNQMTCLHVSFRLLPVFLYRNVELIATCRGKCVELRSRRVTSWASQSVCFKPSVS